MLEVCGNLIPVSASIHIHRQQHTYLPRVHLDFRPPTASYIRPVKATHPSSTTNHHSLWLHTRNLASGHPFVTACSGCNSSKTVKIYLKTASVAFTFIATATRAIVIQSSELAGSQLADTGPRNPHLSGWAVTVNHLQNVDQTSSPKSSPGSRRKIPPILHRSLSPPGI